jgi:hypothetical protein
MSVVVPVGARVAHWTGALQRRLKQAPLECFVRMHAPIALESKGFNVPDALVAAADFILNEALLTYTTQHGTALNEPQCWVIGCACAALCDGFTAGIEQPEEWLPAALQSAQTLLIPPLGPALAMQCAMLSVQNYLDSREALQGPREFGAMCRAATYAMTIGTPAALKVATQLVSQRILARRAVPAFTSQVATG